MYSLKYIIEELGADCAAIMSPHKSNDYLYCSASYNMPSDWDVIKNPMDDSTNNGKVFLSGKSYVAEHIDIDFVNHFISSVVIVPIIAKGKIISTLEVIITNKKKSFNTDALNKTQKLTEQLVAGLKY